MVQHRKLQVSKKEVEFDDSREESRAGRG